MNALSPTRPTRLRSVVCATPSTMVRKMIGAMTIRTRFTKVSPTGFIARPADGQIAPTSTPSAIATSTRTVRFFPSRARRDGGSDCAIRLGNGDGPRVESVLSKLTGDQAGHHASAAPADPDRVGVDGAPGFVGEAAEGRGREV